ncbi:MAG: SAM-dependent methyltransferase [Proteobacteria bacterium]|nr:SAM-dependent methyltransferase [Pseudomonadota bacterium]
MKPITMEPIGVVSSSRTTAFDDFWDQEQAAVVLDESRYSAEALSGIADFSHVEIVFLMDQLDPHTVETRRRHPRGNPDWPSVGIFAQRAGGRPNRIGVCVCRVLRVEGGRLHVEGLDAIDGTPVLDIKPWVVEFGPRGTVRQPAWMSELMTRYWR